MKICPVGAELFYADRRTDMTKQIAASRNLRTHLKMGKRVVKGTFKSFPEDTYKFRIQICWRRWVTGLRRLKGRRYLYFQGSAFSVRGRHVPSNRQELVIQRSSVIQDVS